MNAEDLKVGGVYKHCEEPLFVACTAIGKYGGLEGIALNSYNGIEQGYVSNSWFVHNFEPFDIGLSLDQNKFEAVTKADNLNYWRKVGEELPGVREEHYWILTKSDDNRLDVISILNGYDKDVVKFLLKNYVEWKPID